MSTRWGYFSSFLPGSTSNPRKPSETAARRSIELVEGQHTKSMWPAMVAMMGVQGVNPRCRPVLAIVGFAATLSTLFIFALLLAPALLRSSLQDMVCESVAMAAQTHAWVEQEQENEVRTLMDCATPTAPTNNPNFSVLMGVFSTVSRVERRNIIRLAYGVQHTDVARVAIRFVVGKPKNQEERLQLGLESLRYGDMLVLDMEENMNKGKTWKFFSTVASMGVRFDYVMKVDDDAYVRVHNLAVSLAEQPRSDLYYGYVLPCENTDAYSGYMAGMGYLVTWDLVRYIHESPIVRKQIGGYSEDRLMGDWLNAGGRARNRVSKKPMFYDHPDYTGRDRCTHALDQATILIHQMKTTKRWLDVLQFFEGGRVAGPTPEVAS